MPMLVMPNGTTYYIALQLMTGRWEAAVTAGLIATEQA
jgi:hypothetical protein